MKFFITRNISVRSAATLVACFCVVSTASAQEISVTPEIPVNGLPILDFRIENCTGQVGFGLLVYGTLATAHHLTDLCFAEDTGLVVTGEVSRNLTITSDGRNGRVFEDLSMGPDQYSRNHIHFTDDQNAPGCVEDAIESFEYVVLNPSGYEGFTGGDTNFAYTIGYTIPATTNMPFASSAEVLLGVRNILLTDTFEHATADGDMYAQVNFDGPDGTLEIIEGAGYQFGDANGTLTIQIGATGEIDVVGSFVAQSNRIAGQQPSDMSVLEGEVLHFRGHLLGAEGGQILGYGVVAGTLTEVSGTERPFRASTYLISCLTSAE
ncbi:MAG: hypothetical protein AAFX45_12740 [Pseudomonadota bacterium]